MTAAFDGAAARPILYPIAIAGLGVAEPAFRRASDAIDREAGREPGTLTALCGVAARPVAQAETQEDLAAAAAEAALADAGWRAAELDLVLSACAVPRQPIPAFAPLLMRRLGVPAGRAGAYDVNATCLSFLVALEHAGALLTAGRVRRVLIVSAELASRALPWAEAPGTAGLFGDGAAAACVTTGSAGQGVLASAFETYPAAYEACELAAGGTRLDYWSERAAFEAGTFFRMDGLQLYRATLRAIGPFVARLLETAGWRAQEVDVVAPHQASPLALAHLRRRFGFAEDRVVDIMAEHGNQVAASLPMALATARARGLAGAGARVLLIGTSAGISLGGMALRA